MAQKMKKISLDSVLLFSFVIPFIMTHPLGIEGTPYILFSFIFLLLFLYIVLDLKKLPEKKYFQLKSTVLWITIITVWGSAFISAIIVRHQIHPIFRIHDIVIQQEAAIRLLLHGKNPYAETYFDTPLEEWHYSSTEENPALYHFVMEPFYIIFAIPFYVVSTRTLGYFDGRIPLIVLFFGLLVLAAKLVKDNRKKLLFLIFLAFNPAILGYTLEGRSDLFMFPFLFAGFYLLHKGKYVLSGIPIALAFAIKQSAWPILPFYIAFLYFKQQSVSKVAKSLLPFILSFGAIVVPFLLWDWQAFIASTIFYLSGSIQHSYPIAGYGWGMLLHQLGFIRDAHQYYPFHLWQLVFGVPLFVVLVKFLRGSLTVARLILVYGIFLFAFWYFSRYFNNSHLAYLSLVFITAYFWPEERSSHDYTS